MYHTDFVRMVAAQTAAAHIAVVVVHIAVAVAHTVAVHIVAVHIVAVAVAHTVRIVVVHLNNLSMVADMEVAHKAVVQTAVVVAQDYNP